MKLLILIPIFLHFSTVGQTTKSYVIYSRQTNGGLCSKSFKLFSDSTFSSESGCEASSHIAFGIWSKKGNTIKLVPINLKLFSIIKNVETTVINSDSLFITILDKYGINISRLILVSQSRPDKRSYTLPFDSSRNCRSDRKIDSSALILTYFQRLFGKRSELNIGKSNNLVIHLNISIDNIWNSKADWDNYESFELIQKGNKLISTTFDTVDENWKLIRSEYLKR